LKDKNDKCRNELKNSEKCHDNHGIFDIFAKNIFVNDVANAPKKYG